MEFRLMALVIFTLSSIYAISASSHSIERVLQPRMMLACGTPSSQIFSGGYVVTKTCSGWPISGVGTTFDAANTNATGFSGLIANGNRCLLNTSDVYSFSGGYRANFQCSSKYISGIGSTATDVGMNALAFAQLDSAVGGYPCLLSGGDVNTFSGGYRVSFSCKGRMISGVGTTATDAGKNALGFSELNAGGGSACVLQPNGVRVVGLTYEVTFYCGSQAVIGIGSTATSAGLDALANAGG